MNQLKKFRVKSFKTQTEVAALVGVTQPTYQRWEKGAAIPPDKLEQLSKVFGTSPPILLGNYPVVEAYTFSGGSATDVEIFGTVVFHFVGGGRPLCLVISRAEYKSLFRDLQADTFYVEVRSLSNQLVAIRREAIADVWLLGEDSDHNPESEPYEEPPIVLPDDRDWMIIDLIANAGDLGGYDDALIMSIYERVFGPSDEELSISFPVESDREAAKSENSKRADAISDLASKVKYQLSNGRVREMSVLDEEQMHSSLYAIFEHDGFGGNDPIIYTDIDGGSIFINPRAIDYLHAPKHAFEKGADDITAKELQEAESL